MENSKFLQNTGWWLLTFLSFMPLFLWFLGGQQNLMFSSWPVFVKNLGDVLGLCGIAMFSLVLILSARFRFFEKFFKGINESYTAHHFFGGVTLCLLLSHPLLLAYNYFSISFESAAVFLIPGTSGAQDFGIYGLVVMIITLVITFYTKLKYHVWKFTHKFIGVAFIFAFLHTFLIGADISSNPWLKAYLLVLGILAIVIYFYRTLFADYLVRVLDYTVKDIKSFPDKIWEVELNPKGKSMDFTAGQFVFLKFHSDLLTKETHPFSMSSAPGTPLKLAIKELGDYTNEVSQLKIGDGASIEGPFGSFNFKNNAGTNQIWIAGGIGITPFLSMLRSLTNNDSNYKIDLYYSVKNEACLSFRDEINAIASANKNLNVRFWLTDKDGFINAEAIKRATGNIANKDIFICGPDVMMIALKRQFLEQNIKRAHIHTEEFKLY